MSHFEEQGDECFNAFHQLRGGVEAAIQEFANHHDDTTFMPGRWVLLGEVTDMSTGERQYVPASAEGMEHWEVVGLADALPDAWLYAP